MKTITQEVKNAIDTGAPRVQLIRMELASGTVRLTTCGHDLTWQGQVYLSTSLLLELSRVRSNSEIRVGTRTLSYTAADPTILAEVSNNVQVNRLITQFEAYLDPQGKIIPDPIHKHSWLYTGHELKGSKLSIDMASEWALFKTTSGRRTTSESQKRFFPDDNIFDFVPRSSEEVLWGE